MAAVENRSFWLRVRPRGEAIKPPMVWLNWEQRSYGRSQEKVEIALQEIRHAAGNDKIEYSSQSHEGDKIL